MDEHGGFGLLVFSPVDTGGRPLVVRYKRRAEAVDLRRFEAEDAECYCDCACATCGAEFADACQID